MVSAIHEYAGVFTISASTPGCSTDTGGEGLLFLREAAIAVTDVDISAIMVQKDSMLYRVMRCFAEYDVRIEIIGVSCK